MNGLIARIKAHPKVTAGIAVLTAVVWIIEESTPTPPLAWLFGHARSGFERVTALVQVHSTIATSVLVVEGAAIALLAVWALRLSSRKPACNADWLHRLADEQLRGTNRVILLGRRMSIHQLGTPSPWIEFHFDFVNAHVWPIAMRSVEGHVSIGGHMFGQTMELVKPNAGDPVSAGDTSRLTVRQWITPALQEIVRGALTPDDLLAVDFTRVIPLYEAVGPGAQPKRFPLGIESFAIKLPGRAPDPSTAWMAN